MKTLISLYLALSMALGPLMSWGAEEKDTINPIDRASVEKELLEELKSRVGVFLDLNVGKLISILNCLKMRPCDDEKLEPIFEKINIQYPRMRKHLFLHNVLAYKNLARILWLYVASVKAYSKGQTVAPTLAFEKLIIDNPLEESTMKDEELPMPDWSNTEIESALDDTYFEGFNTNLIDMCKSTMNYYKRSLELCSRLHLQFSATSRSFNFAISHNERNWKEDLEDLKYLRPEFSKDFFKRAEDQQNLFFEVVQLNPYIALVPSAAPTTNELAHAFEIMLERAKKSQSEFTELSRELEAKSGVRYDRNSWLKLLKYDAVLMDTVANPVSFEITSWSLKVDLQEVAYQLMKDYTHKELKHMAVQLGALIGANMVICYTPARVFGYFGRLYKFARVANAANRSKKLTEVFFNPFCFPLTQFPINYYFFNDAREVYSQAYQEVFSTLDGEFMIREVSALSDTQRGVFWSIALGVIPFGVKGALKEYQGAQLAAARELKLQSELAAHVPSLSERSINVLRRLMGLQSQKF